MEISVAKWFIPGNVFTRSWVRILAAMSGLQMYFPEFSEDHHLKFGVRALSYILELELAVLLR